MAVSLVELNGTISRTQDYSIQRQNEYNKGLMDQSNIQLQQDKKEQNNATTVQQSSQSAKGENQADAKEKGKGFYAGDGGKNRKKNQGDGKVIKKGQSHFDMSV